MPRRPRRVGEMGTDLLIEAWVGARVGVCRLNERMLSNVLRSELSQLSELGDGPGDRGRAVVSDNAVLFGRGAAGVAAGQRGVGFRAWPSTG